ncbi:MAG: ABC transporter substrate-binding protein [Tepidisphaerales bacterium]
MPLAFSLCGCHPAAKTTRPTTRPTIVSLVPAATDLIVGMGAADHLVAVSNYDRREGPIADLPRAGDYANIDWERIASLRPDVLIVFMAPERMPPALKQKAEEYHLRLANVRIERLEDVFGQLRVVGDLVQEPAKAAAVAARLRQQLDAVRARTAGQAKVPTLIVREASLMGVVGRENFLNDLLEIAGGENVIDTPGWPQIDKEKLLACRPGVIIHLMPGADAAAVAQARAAWRNLPLGDETREHIHILTDWHLLQGGVHVGQTAEEFARVLHPAP